MLKISSLDVPLILRGKVFKRQWDLNHIRRQWPEQCMEKQDLIFLICQQWHKKILHIKKTQLIKEVLLIKQHMGNNLNKAQGLIIKILKIMKIHKRKGLGISLGRTKNLQILLVEVFRIKQWNYNLYNLSEFILFYLFMTKNVTLFHN